MDGSKGDYTWSSLYQETMKKNISKQYKISISIDFSKFVLSWMYNTPRYSLFTSWKIRELEETHKDVILLNYGE